MWSTTVKNKTRFNCLWHPQSCGSGILTFIHPGSRIQQQQQKRREEHICCQTFFSVVDLHWFQCGFGPSIFGQCWSGSDDQKLGKTYSWENLYFFLSTTGIYSSQGLHKGRPSNKKSLYPSKENIPQFKLEISVSPSGSGYGSSRLKLMRIHTNPDPKHFFL